MRLWGSFRSRLLSIAVVLAIALAGLAFYSHRLINETAVRGVALADESRRLQKTLDELVWTLQATEASLYLHVLDPTAATDHSVRGQLVAVRNAFDALSADIDPARFPHLAEQARGLNEDFQRLKTGAVQLLELVTDVEQRFPAMSLVRSELYPSSQRFLMHLAALLAAAEGDRELSEILLELRHFWTRQLMESRLFFANRFGVYGAPAESMERNLHDRGIYTDQVARLLEKVAQRDLPFGQADAVANMREAAADYEAVFEKVAAIYRSADWRRDLPLMHSEVDPALVRMWERVQRMSARLDSLLEQGLMTSVERARVLGYSLWVTSGIAYCLILLGYVAFERAIRRPLHKVASALEAEGRGEPAVPLPAAGTDEVRLLNAAFDGMRRQVRSRQLRLSSILEHAHDGILTFDRDGRVESLNRAAERLFGSQASELIGQPISRLIPGLEPGAFPELVGEADTGSENEPIVTAVREDGSAFRMSLKISRLELDGEPLYTALVADVTEREELLERLRRMATYDALTGLYNRRFFMEELGRVMDRAARGESGYALLYIDLDNFKYVNDTLGHLVGDRVLVEVTALLQDRLRRGDLLARLGGDEFAVLLHDSDSEQAAVAAERFRKALADYRLRVSGETVDVGCSIGIAVLDETVSSREELLARADLACHIAKQQGRNRSHLYGETDRESQTTMSLDMGWSRRLKEALATDGFALVAQPVNSLATGAQLFQEVFLRLPRGGDDLMMPSGFLPAAERFGLLTRIDIWVIDRVVQLLAEQGGGPFAINLSGQAIRDGRVLKALLRAIDRTGISPSNLYFEIGEAAALSDLAATADFLQALRNAGCITLMDDFGAGYFSFLYLKELPVDYVKIDGSLIAGIVSDPVRRTMLAAINDIAHATGKRTIAEQVEDADTRTVLEELGIDYAQGWHFGTPHRLWGGREPRAGSLAG